MRKDLAKVLFVGVEKEKAAFFKKAQEIGLLEFIGTSRTYDLAHQGEITLFTSALKILRGLTVIEQLIPADPSSANAIAESIVATKNAIEKLYEKKRLLQAEILRIKPFGRFALPKIGNLVFQFFISKVSARPEIEGEEGLFLISSDEMYDYWLSINFHKRPALPHSHEVFFEKSLDQLEGALREVNEEIGLREQDLRMAAQYSQFLHRILGEKLNEAMLHSAKEASQGVLGDRLFISRAWIPAHKMDALQELCKDFNVVAEEAAIDPTDQIPTYLENKGNARVGEDLVSIYDTPSITDKDPSPWVFWFFILFFAIIINDAGYGLLFLIGTLYYKYKHPIMKPVVARIVTLATYLSVACILWGILNTSYFGIAITPDNPLRKLSVIDWLVEKKAEYHMSRHDVVYQELVQEHPQLAQVSGPQEFANYAEMKGNLKTYPVSDQFSSVILFELALLIGVIHVGLSILRNARRNWAGLGWLIFIIGGYLYFPVYLGATSMVNTVLGITPQEAGRHGLEMICVGGGLAFLLAIIQRRISGLLEVMTLVQIFCDILSYLRLYALGLAGMMMAITFNEMASSAGPFFGIIILLVGHTVNMTMAIMGGIIHGLRLNFLEWYHYSFEGGGKQFNPLKIYK